MKADSEGGGGKNLQFWFFSCPLFSFFQELFFRNFFFFRFFLGNLHVSTQTQVRTHTKPVLPDRWITKEAEKKNAKKDTRLLPVAFLFQSAICLNDASLM